MLVFSQEYLSRLSNRLLALSFNISSCDAYVKLIQAGSSGHENGGPSFHISRIKNGERIKSPG